MTTHRPVKRVVLAIIGILAVATPLAGCSQKTPIATPTPTASQIKTLTFDLYTHCGIIDVMAYGRYFKRVGGSLSDGSGNPPDGWGNPYQPGSLSVSGNIAVFRDKLGHIERFKAAKQPDMSVARCS